MLSCATKFTHEPENFLAQSEKLRPGGHERPWGKQILRNNLFQGSLCCVQVVQGAFEAGYNEGSFPHVAAIGQTIERAGELGGSGLVFVEQRA